jgi:glycerophosphoryl diester phosphodiesterase
MSFASDFVVLGHRGAAGLLPENTLPSFQKAWECGARAIELDVYCVDGTLVVIHDETVDRTTNGRGTVESFTLPALRALDAGDGAPIPLLDEVLDWLPSDMAINIELKGRGTAAPVAECLQERLTLRSQRCMVSSFDHRALERFRALAADLDILVAPLYHQWRATWQGLVTRLATRWLNLNHRLITAERMAEISAAGVSVLAYTVNTLERAEELKALGVRGVFTDRPDLLINSKH